MFGLEGCGFIISLALILLVSGAIMFYCLRRFSILENSIIDQGKVLQSFIIKMQQQQMNDSPISAGLATDVAIESALEQIENQTPDILNSEKIEVSDNELESESDDDDDDTSCQSDDDNENNLSMSTKLIDEVHTVELHDINFDPVKSDAIKTDTSMAFPTDGVKIIAIEELSNDMNLNMHSSDLNDDSISSVSNESAIVLTNTVILSDIEPSIEISNEISNISKKLPHSKMKVNDLRTLAYDRGLIDNTEMANKLKKEDLIKILNK